MTRPNLDDIEARADACPQIIPHFPQDDGTALLCLADDDTDVGRLWPVGRAGNAAPMHALIILFAFAKGDLATLVAYARELERVRGGLLNCPECRGLGEINTPHVVPGLHGEPEERGGSWQCAACRGTGVGVVAGVVKENAELLLVIANERGEGEPPVAGWTFGFPPGADNDLGPLWFCGAARVWRGPRSMTDGNPTWWWAVGATIGTEAETARAAIRAASVIDGRPFNPQEPA